MCVYVWCDIYVVCVCGVWWWCVYMCYTMRSVEVCVFMCVYVSCYIPGQENIAGLPGMGPWKPLMAASPSIFLWTHNLSSLPFSVYLSHFPTSLCFLVALLWLFSSRVQYYLCNHLFNKTY